MKEPSPIFYTISLVAAFMIGIDCAINIWLPLSNFSLLPILGSIYLLVPIAIAGFTLNFILYKRDFPAAASNLYDSISNFFTNNKTSSDKETIISVISEVIALASAITMFAFTVNSYLCLGLPHIPTYLIFALSAANAIGTYGLLRKSVNAEDLKNYMKWLHEQSPLFKAITIIIFAALLYATWFTIGSFQNGALNFTSSYLSSSITIPLSFTLKCFIWLGESCFALSVSIYLAKGIKNLDINKISKNDTLIPISILMSLALLNSLGNGAITALGSDSIVLIVMGSLLSFSSFMETIVEISSKNTITSKSERKGTKYALYTIGGAMATWAFTEFALPILFPSISSASITGILIISTAVALISTIFCWLDSIHNEVLRLSTKHEINTNNNHKNGKKIDVNLKNNNKEGITPLINP